MSESQILVKDSKRKEISALLTLRRYALIKRVAAVGRQITTQLALNLDEAGLVCIGDDGTDITNGCPVWLTRAGERLAQRFSMTCLG